MHHPICASAGRLSISVLVTAEDSLESETEADIESITRLAQAILKREWRRVKSGT